MSVLLPDAQATIEARNRGNEASTAKRLATCVCASQVGVVYRLAPTMEARLVEHGGYHHCRSCGAVYRKTGYARYLLLGVDHFWEAKA